MPTYDPHGVLAAVDANLTPILVLATFTIVSIYVCFGEALRLGFKYKKYSLSIAANAYFLAHDFTFVALYEKWFFEIDHWFVKLFWVALVVTSVFEALFVYQTIKFAHKELLPQVSAKTFGLLIVAMQAAVFVVFLIVKRAMNDELFLINYGITVFWLMPFTIPIVARRGTQEGQSTLFTLGALGIALGFWPMTYLLDPYFRTPLWIGLGLVTVAWGIANIVLLKKFPTKGQGAMATI